MASVVLTTKLFLPTHPCRVANMPRCTVPKPPPPKSERRTRLTIST
jgi:hypothetical protein